MAVSGSSKKVESFEALLVSVSCASLLSPGRFYLDPNILLIGCKYVHAERFVC